MGLEARYIFFRGGDPRGSSEKCVGVGVLDLRVRSFSVKPIGRSAKPLSTPLHTAMPVSDVIEKKRKQIRLG